MLLFSVGVQLSNAMSSVAVETFNKALAGGFNPEAAAIAAGSVPAGAAAGGAASIAASDATIDAACAAAGAAAGGTAAV